VAQLAGGPEEEEHLQGKFATAQLKRQLQPQKAPRTNNTGLPDQLKSGIESLSGLSMDHVRVHYNSSQPAQLNALAYAQGSEIHVAPGQEQHLPHEAWHVVQQAQGRVRPTLQLKDRLPVNDDVRLEREADVIGARAMRMVETLPRPIAQRMLLPSDQVLQGVFKVLASSPSGTTYQDDKTKEIMSFIPPPYKNGNLVLQNNNASVVIDKDGNELERHEVPQNAYSFEDDYPGVQADVKDDDVDVRPSKVRKLDASKASPGVMHYPPDHSEAELSKGTLQKAKLTTALSTQISLIPVAEGQVRKSPMGVIERTYTPDQLHVLEIRIGDKDRPETRFDNQESHTVSWTLVRNGIEGLADQNLLEFLKYMNEAFVEIRELVEVAEGKLLQEMAAGHRIIETIQAGRLPIDVWQRLSSLLLIHYMQVYQMSRGATYKRGRAVGHGEAHAMDRMRRDEAALAAGKACRPAAKVTLDAAKLLDVQFRLEALGIDAYAVAVFHWINMLQKAFPNLMHKYQIQIIHPVLNKQLAPSFKEALGKNKKDPFTVRQLLELNKHEIAAVTIRQKTQLHPEEISAGDVALGDLHTNFVANIGVAPVTTGQPQERKVTPKVTIRDFGYAASSIALSHVMISDFDRPKTKFLSHQKSHTVPWTLARATLKSFQGKPALELMKYLFQRFQELLHAIKLKDGIALANHALDLLKKHLHDILPIDRWQHLLSECVRLYFIAYQVAESTSYINPDESDRAQGHGEAANMLVLRRNEYTLNTHAGILDDEDRILKAILGMFDAQFTARLSEAAIKEAYTGMQHKLELTFPLIFKHFGPKAFANMEKLNIGKGGRTLGEIMKDKSVVMHSAHFLPLVYRNPFAAEHFVYPPNSLVDAHGDIRPARMPDLVAAYRRDLVQGRPYLTEAEGNIVALMLGLHVHIVQGGIPDGFRRVENPGGGDCLIHALIQIWHRMNGRHAFPAGDDQILELREGVAVRLPNEYIEPLVTAAVGAAIAGVHEPGLGRNMLNLLSDASVTAAHFAQLNQPKVSSTASSKPSAKSSAPTSSKKAAPAPPPGPTVMTTIGVRDAVNPNFALLHVGAHYVMIERTVPVVPSQPLPKCGPSVLSSK
jgi:hypothetical protein